MANEELHRLDATTALRLFTKRELSPVELMRAVIARAEVTEPRINAFSHTFFEQAMDEARRSEARYFKGEPCGVLDGLPVAMKDEIDVAGQPVTEGSLIYRERIAGEDAALTARLRLLALEHPFAPVRGQPQSVESRRNAGWVIGRLRRRAGGRVGAAGHGLGHRRLDPFSGVDVRRGRVQAAVWAGSRNLRAV
jgi:hypothetical protein